MRAEGADNYCICTSPLPPLPPQINQLSPEWQYLFDMAGVSRAMLEDKATLQFILDTVHKIGGAPCNLDQVQDEAVDPQTTGT